MTARSARPIYCKWSPAEEAELNKSSAYKGISDRVTELELIDGCVSVRPDRGGRFHYDLSGLAVASRRGMQLFRNRPDYAISELNIEYQKRQINLSKAKYNPSLAIGFQRYLGYADVERERFRTSCGLRPSSLP